MDNERDVLLRRRIQELVRARVSLLEQDISRLQREVIESFNSLLEQADVTTSLPDEDTAFAQIAAEVTAQVDRAGAEALIQQVIEIADSRSYPGGWLRARQRTRGLQLRCELTLIGSSLVRAGKPPCHSASVLWPRYLASLSKHH